MSLKPNSLELLEGDAESLLHILWLRLVEVMRGYQNSYGEDLEITMIERLSEQLGERFKIVVVNGVSKVSPRDRSIL